MNISSSAGVSFRLDDELTRDPSAPHDTLQKSPGHSRVRREDTEPTSPVSIVVKDEDVLKVVHDKVVQAKASPDSSAYLKGYNTPSSVSLPGYSAPMSDLELLRLAVDHPTTPEQLGAIQRLSEQRVIGDTQANVSLFSKVMSGKGVKVTPMSQSYYLSMINRLSPGQCSGISHLLSLAVAEGKQHVFLGNVFQAVANPDDPESREFFNKLAEVHEQTKYIELAADPKKSVLGPYTDIAPRLLESKTTQTLLISGENHRVSAGVMVDANNNRTYYFAEPNYGLVEFSSYELFEEGLKKVFAGSELKGSFKPMEEGGYFSSPKYKISVFDPDYISDVSPAQNDVRFMYDAPLGDLEKIKVIDTSRLPLAEHFRGQTSTPEPAVQVDYEQVVTGLEKLHVSKGMSQYHQTKAVLGHVQQFIENHPDSYQVSAMKALEQKLINAINEAAAPVKFPSVFERMENDRIGLAKDKLGPKKQVKTEYRPYAKINITTDANSEPSRSKQVADGISTALQTIDQSDPNTWKLIGTDISVVIARPGDQAETQIRLGREPTLIIGDDFFASPSASNNTVADRVGHQAKANGGDGIAQKQAALIAGKFGLLSHYRAHPNEFLATIDNEEPFRESGHQLSTRASRTPLDFMEQSFTARLYDGKLDSQAQASLDKLLSPPRDAPQSVSSTPSTPAAPIDPAQVERLQKLDVSHPPVRIGELNVSRVELYKMGASIDGKPIENPLPGDADSHQLINKVQIDLEKFQAHLKGSSSDVGDRVTNVIAEIGAHRSTDSAPLFRSANSGPVLESLQNSVRDLSVQHAQIKKLEQSKKPIPSDFFSPETPGKSGAKNNAAGLGFQAFGTFQTLRSSIESLQNGDTTEGAVGLGSVAAEYVGMGVEAGLNKVAQKTASRVAPTIVNFKSSSIGKMVGRVGGGVAATITVPFDIYNAVDSFNKAAASTGKEAQDHYVNGAFSVAGAVTSITLGVAFMAGAAAAGPAGLIVAGVLMAAQSIYSAVRTVEEIDQYTPLTDGQKFTIGVKSFLGFEPGFDVIKPYLEKKYADEHEQQSKVRYQAFLDGPGKEYFERVVYGSADVEAKLVPGKVPLTPSLWYSPITWLLNLIPVNGQVPHVEIAGGNDHISGHKSWNGKPINAVEGLPGETKATLWDMGDGDDWVTGIETKPNYFLLGAGKKGVSGGNADDTVVLNADARQTLAQAEQVSTTDKDGFSPRQTSLNGGGGRNTLSFSGALTTPYKEDGADKVARYAGHVVNFKTNTISIKTQESNTEGVKKIAHFQSFSNVTTVERGQSFIQGNDENHMFTLNGQKDVLFTGNGANVIVINGGARITGEGGNNTYIVNRAVENVIIEDPGNSIVRLDYSAAQLSGWRVSPSGDLSVDTSGDTPWNSRALVFNNAFSSDTEDDRARPVFITNDGVTMVINAPRQAGSSIRTVQVSSVKVETGNPQT